MLPTIYFLFNFQFSAVLPPVLTPDIIVTEPLRSLLVTEPLRSLLVTAK